MVVKNVDSPANLENEALSRLTFADCHERLGAIPLDRIRWYPFPGTATEDDLIRVNERKQGLCELVDGVLVAKAMGATESLLGGYLLRMVGNFAEEHDLGVVLGEGGMYRFQIGLVRLRDVSFVPWTRLPDDKTPDDAVWVVIPTLTIEVLSRSNTAAEIERKIGEYFTAGVKSVWTIEPKKKSARVYSSPTAYKLIDETGTLDGGKILPGFKLPLKQLFAAGQRRKKGS